MNSIGNFFGRFELPRLQSCYQRASEAIYRIVNAVKEFFQRLIQTICCRIRRTAPPRFQVPPVFNPIAPQPVGIDALRAALRTGRYVHISNELTLDNFIALIDEFPQQQDRIGRWAEEWARNRPIKIDPNHPFFEIFQRAFELKDHIAAGRGRSADYTTYSINNENYHGFGMPLFPYIIYSLMGFQEMNRGPAQELMRKLDNHRPTFGENPAYRFARALSKIYAYPTRPDNGENRMDIRDKLQMGIPSPMEAFQVAKAQNKVLEYFQTAFQLRNCFDYRVSEFQQFVFKSTHPNVDDFSPNLVGKDTTDHRILEYYRVFRNEQAFKMAQERALEYEQLKNQINMGAGNENMQRFYQQYCTKEHFTTYLQENYQPIRVRSINPVGQPIEIIPQQNDWRGDLPQSVKKVPIAMIPPNLRQVGAVLGVRDPNRYEVQIGRINHNTGRAILYLTERKVNENGLFSPPLIVMQEGWKGQDRKEVDLNLIPLNRRYVNGKVLLSNPSIELVKVFAIDGDTATIDFRGDPINQPRWERVLDDTYWAP